jgi:hypothetical protein
MPVATKCFENVAKLKYLEIMATKQNYIHKEIKSTVNSGNACDHAIQNLLSSHLLSKNVITEIYKTLFFIVLLHDAHINLNPMVKSSICITTPHQSGITVISIQCVR